MSIRCNVCNTKFEEPIFLSKRSLTSLCNIVDAENTVYFCRECQHIQSSEIQDINKYYDENYHLLVDSEEEDQVYHIDGDIKIFRYDHQVDTINNLLDISKNANILDYGCAKATTLRRLLNIRPDISPYLYDVSNSYVEYWKKFVNQTNYAVHKLPEEWFGAMNIVTSFFALEHVASPAKMLKNIWDLLGSDGIFYCIVPNVINNIADFVVADHVNHFTQSSIRRLFSNCGFEIMSIDSDSHNSALIIIAKKIAIDSKLHGCNYLVLDTDNIEAKVSAIAEYWNNLTYKIKAFEAKIPPTSGLAIYGSGFYGAYIASNLDKLNQVHCFLDRDPYRQNKKFFNKVVIDPDLLPHSVNTVMVGLNPLTAKKNIEQIKSWRDRNISYLYL